MPLLGFQGQFADAVEAGLHDLRGEARPARLVGVLPKYQTIRAQRADGREPQGGRQREQD